jgi:tyrosyl-tRNA synthetase
MKVDTDPKKIEQVLTRGVEAIYPSRKSLEEALRSGKRLKIYNGIDPTGKLHIGHLVALRKLRQLQNLGHEIIVLIGGFTAMIGDPTDKLATRKPLTREQVSANAKNYKTHIGKILDLKRANVRVLNNEEWINRLKPKDFLEIASRFTVARLLERDMFQRRIKDGKEIHLHEFLYPILQAYDSVAMDVDMEIGGNDQTFNMLAGRDLMKKLKNKEKLVMSLKLLTDSGGKKMGKTEGNLISLDEEPKEMFGKIMAWPDHLIGIGLELLTGFSQNEIGKIVKQIQLKKLNPREVKARLAKEVTASCYNQKLAASAEREFEKVFREKKIPQTIARAKMRERKLNILDLLVKTKLVSSKSEAKRLVLQKGVKVDGEIEDDWRKVIEIKKDQVLQVGKRRFVKLTN